MSEVPARARPDACPGVFATHDAADGALARVRLPGGRVTSAQLRVLADCAEELGDGSAHLTSRGNVQLRGLSRDTGELVARLSAAGLLPAPSHERVRNFLASPLSGLAGGLVDVRPLVASLDAAVCARPELAALPGRFLFALDDGRGDVAAEDADVCWQATEDGGVLLLAGQVVGPEADPVPALVREALRFLEIRGDAWRMRELPRFAGAPRQPARPVRVGEFARDDGGRGLCIAPLFGELPSSALRLLAESPEVVVTPWRTVVVPEFRTELSALSTDSQVSACIGRPGCAKSLADVRADARKVSARAHFSGCARRCGKPRDAADVVAENGGYRVEGDWVPADRVAESLVQKGKA
ncbi:precorrin-3B synthase [Amycolatopsis acidicola]|uniref:Precorrin-3B synthase n=1 Tax=Amycolatopsis acidicola TaxID=2596893 RepID=A0A5N0URB6_9PSEU|nr:nitrite/sulfite reductase [Amycolatopsis acidicola]KAA9153275.1 precorrin-3B synthase [Amycolatopsis acidicola]